MHWLVISVAKLNIQAGINELKVDHTRYAASTASKVGKSLCCAVHCAVSDHARLLTCPYSMQTMQVASCAVLPDEPQSGANLLHMHGKQHSCQQAAVYASVYCY